MDNDKNFLRRHRMAVGLRLKDVSDQLGISKQLYNQMENTGKINNKYLSPLSKILRINMKILIKENEKNELLSDTINYYRKKSNISIVELAKLLDLPPCYISRWNTKQKKIRKNKEKIKAILQIPEVIVYPTITSSCSQYLSIEMRDYIIIITTLPAEKKYFSNIIDKYHKKFLIAHTDELLLEPEPEPGQIEEYPIEILSEENLCCLELNNQILIISNTDIHTNLKTIAEITKKHLIVSSDYIKCSGHSLDDVKSGLIGNTFFLEELRKNLQRYYPMPITYSDEKSPMIPSKLENSKIRIFEIDKTTTCYVVFHYLTDTIIHIDDIYERVIPQPLKKSSELPLG